MSIETARIVVFCDAHPRRSIAHRLAKIDGRWVNVMPPTGQRTSTAMTVKEGGQLASWIADSPEDLERTMETLREGEHRRHRIVCRKCKRHPLELREGDLFAALDAVASVGESEVSMSGLAAIVVEQKRYSR